MSHQKWLSLINVGIKVVNFSVSGKFQAVSFTKERTTLDTLAERNSLKKTRVSDVRSLKHGLSTAAIQAGRKITRTDRLTDWKQYCPPLYSSRHISYKSLSSVPELASRHTHQVLWRSTKHILSCPWARQLSQYLTVHAGFLRDECGVLGETRKETPCTSSIFYNKAFLEDNMKPLYGTLHKNWIILANIYWCFYSLEIRDVDSIYERIHNTLCLHGTVSILQRPIKFVYPTNQQTN